MRRPSPAFGACTSSTKMPTTYRVTGDIFNVEDTLRFLHSDEKNSMNFFPLWRDKIEFVGGSEQPVELRQ